MDIANNKHQAEQTEIKQQQKTFLKKFQEKSLSKWREQKRLTSPKQSQSIQGAQFIATGQKKIDNGEGQEVEI